MQCPALTQLVGPVYAMHGADMASHGATRADPPDQEQGHAHRRRAEAGGSLSSYAIAYSFCDVGF